MKAAYRLCSIRDRLAVRLTCNGEAMVNTTDTSSYFTNHPFLWGAASTSYQEEGVYKADGKGESNWDVWLHQYHLASNRETGNVPIIFYDRNQYLKDIALMKKLRLNNYRFSIAWMRIISDGTGSVNKAGIEPVMTLYHWW